MTLDLAYMWDLMNTLRKYVLMHGTVRHLRIRVWVKVGQVEGLQGCMGDICYSVNNNKI